MRALYVFAALSVAALTMVPGVNAQEQKNVEGDKLPDVAYPDLEGESLALSSLKGHPVILDVWATWCPPCREAMPKLQAFHEKHGEGEKGLKVIGLSVDKQSDPVKAYLEENDITFTILWAPGNQDDLNKLAKAIGLRGIPRTLFIDDEGVVRADLLGLHSDEDYAKALKSIGVE